MVAEKAAEVAIDDSQDPEEPPVDWLITFLLFIFPAMGGLLFGALLDTLFRSDKRTCSQKVKVLQ